MKIDEDHYGLGAKSCQIDNMSQGGVLGVGGGGVSGEGKKVTKKEPLLLSKIIH